MSKTHLGDNLYVGPPDSQVQIADSSGNLFQAGTQVTATATELNLIDGVTATTDELNILDGCTATYTELNLLDGATAGTQVASKAVIADANVNIGVSKVTQLHIGATGSETQITATGAELNQYTITVDMADISTASSVWVVAPHAGDITAIYSVINGAIATANAIITAKIGGVAVTDSSITIAFSGSAAGDVDSSTPSAANTVTAGQAIEIITDGGSANAVRATFTIVITR